MPAALTYAEAGLVCLIVLVVVGFVLVYLRRQLIARGRSPFMCGLRPDGSDRFVPGLAAINGSSLEWFRLNGVSLRPSRTWTRDYIDVLPARPVDAPELSSIMVRPLGVHCWFRGEQFDLAVPDACYMALRTWVESMPPGHNVNVA